MVKHIASDWIQMMENHDFYSLDSGCWATVFYLFNRMITPSVSRAVLDKENWRTNLV